MASRQQAANRAVRASTTGLSAMEDDDFPVPTAPAKRASRSPAAPVAETPAAADRQPASRTSMLLEGLKDELFDLEVEHKQGRITQQEYEKTKAALDQTLQRALKRESQRA